MFAFSYPVAIERRAKKMGWFSPQAFADNWGQISGQVESLDLELDFFNDRSIVKMNLQVQTPAELLFEKQRMCRCPQCYRIMVNLRDLGTKIDCFHILMIFFYKKP